MSVCAHEGCENEAEFECIVASCPGRSDPDPVAELQSKVAALEQRLDTTLPAIEQRLDAAEAQLPTVDPPA